MLNRLSHPGAPGTLEFSSYTSIHWIRLVCSVYSLDLALGPAKESTVWWPVPGSDQVNMPTQLEIAMNIMIRIFHQYSCKEGDRFKLNKGELKMLLQQELTEFLSCQKDPQLVDKIMQDLDANKDNEVDFNEFVVMVAALTVACNDYFVEQLKKKGK
ncbi:protein S100-Z isoform X1 [Acinonyx jubatus]|uniref:Protein S100-Z isoform X1 n=1 Tax=Acinonyx jubatus TaxID=32536 RepID=A0ABM3Q884_ACIJB|nr:protein S100-Z isoform X1 [Acinonyx jubatus]